ncbi:MAG: gliding motility-associated C-terminal domain-containing protein [Bacteroidia bacterium]
MSQYVLRNKVLIIMVFVAAGFWAKGTHVVGGEVYYNYVGNDSYYVHLQVYVDCENGRPRAISADSTGTIAIYENLTYNLKKQREVWRTGPLRLNKTQYNCIEPPTGVCVDMYEFDTVFVLNPNTFGYYIAFQRCCRNGSLLNIEDPLGTGATYSAFIPPIDQFGINSNPRFKERPPNYLCVNERFEFDHSATDLDGDSLVYRICAPKNMRSTTPPKPLIPEAPPYFDVIWKAPYDQNNPLPVKNKFSVKSDGKLQFWPTQLGQYVFAVCVDEYREGEFLSSTWRDYQFNVMPCKFNVKSNFSVNSIICGKSLEFKDESKGATEVKWKVEGPGFYEVSDNRNYVIDSLLPGKYKASLVANNGNCTDTFVQRFTVLPNFETSNISLSKCKTDTLILPQRSFYGVETIWHDSSGLLNIDTLKAFAGQTDELFIHKGDFNGCRFVDSYFVDVLIDSFSVNLDTVPHCLGEIFSFSLNKISQYDSVVWSVKSGAFSERFKKLVFQGELLKVDLKLIEGNCKDSVTYMVKAHGEGNIEFEKPNIITPNNDGFNDCYKPLVKEARDVACDNYSITIYNRWGGKVYEEIESSEIPCWDAINYRGGGKVLAGVYYVFVEVDGYSFNHTIHVVY